MTNYLTVAEVAEILGCSRRTAGRAAASQKVGIVAGGRVVAVPEDAVKAIADAIHWFPGNPNWVSEQGKAERQKRRKRVS